MKASVAVFDGDLAANEVQEVTVDLSDFKSGVLWAKKDSGSSVTVSLLAVEDGVGTAGIASATPAPTARSFVPDLPDLGYKVRVQAGGSAVFGVTVTFVGDDGQSSDSTGYTINLTGTVEKE